ncbi:MAG: hypothetical protein HFF71_06320 [Oscillospiraceae bacterium]|jgi:stage II sporulation protein M|nr:hypothetical protein [Oscillospiraceae bacterium]MCI8942626.1 hypothetical protein [Oscillospiraceae bacterium]
MVLRTIRLGGWDPNLIRLLLLALAFLAGALGGHLYAGSCGEEAWEALGQYLGDYCRLYDGGGVEISLLSCVVMYFGYAVLLFLLGFSAAGVVLIPALSGVFGFFTMYTVSCFVRCYGRAGAALALGAMVVRLVFTLPCFFLLAEAAWPLSTELFALSFGRGKRSSPVLYGSRYFLWFVLCAVILALGVFCERLLTPLLFRLALGAI